MIQRAIFSRLKENLSIGKVLVLLGARRTGKTVLLRELAKHIEEPYLLLNGEDIGVQEQLRRRTVINYQQILGSYKVLMIDEAQEIPEIGNILKLIIDEIPDLKVIITGSSAFSINNLTGEPLTGRRKTFYLYPLSEAEFATIETPFERKEYLRWRLVYGNYPELTRIQGMENKEEYLREILNDYLLKDILSYKNILHSNKIFDLLRLIAFQIGGEVSYQELGTQLNISKNTVEEYLDLLSKVFVLYRLSGYSRNLRKEVTKSSKWYFYDNGIRNAIIANFNPIESRNDVGQLWENYILAERIKYQSYRRMVVNNYFWRTYDQQEIDWVEERGGHLFGYEMKWNTKGKMQAPAAWKNNYPEAGFLVVNPDNYTQFLELDIA